MSYLSYTEPTGGVHPRLLFAPSEVSTLRTRSTGSHAAYWSSLTSWTNNHVSDPYTSYTGNNWEYLGAHAFHYLIGQSNSQGDHAIAIAKSIAALSIPSNYDIRRRYLLEMAAVYDWCYDRLTAGDRSTLRLRIWDYVQLMGVSGSELLWGHSHGNLVHALLGLVTILGDGDTVQNTAWRAKLEELLDWLDNGTNSSFLPGFRHFGNTDGGSHKGSGATGYYRMSEEWYAALIPTLSKSLNINLWASETWYTKGIDWLVWHWREDHTLHKTAVESMEQSRFGLHTAVHCLQISDRENNVTGQVALWLANEIESTAYYNIWGPFHLHSILWRNVSRTPTTPTLANLSSGTCMKHFVNAGHICFRDGWDAAVSSSMVVKVPKYYTGGHSKRRDGSFSLNHRGAALVRDQGLYDPNITTTYKVTGDSVQTGHRYTYDKRILAASVGRIYDTNEVSENVVQSFQAQISSSTKFGYQSGGSVVASNDGGQLWPKNVGASKYQPYDLADLLGDSTWQIDGLLASPVGTDRYGYVGVQLSSVYYASKCTKYHRHYLWIQPGVIPGWSWPVVLVWDDLTVHSDAVGNKVYVYQLQTEVSPGGTADDLSVTISSFKLKHRVLKPSSVSYTSVQGFKDLDGVEYPATVNRGGADNVQAGTDAFRIEIWPTSVLTSIEFLAVMFLCPASQSTYPSLALIDDASWLGATIGGVDCKVHRGSPYSASVGTSGDTTPPAAPGTVTPTAGSGLVDLDWPDNSEGDLGHYEVWRAEQL